MKKTTKLTPKPKGTALVKAKTVLPVTVEKIDFQTLVARAIDKSLPVETMERLLAMVEKQKAAWAKEQFFKALSKFQSVCPPVPKTHDVFNKKGEYRYSYAALENIVETVKIPLEVNGLSYTIKTEQNEKEVAAICIAHHIDGHEEQARFAVPIDHDAYMNEAQKVASALTYAKRYAFNNAFGIMTAEDDDDAQVTGSAKKHTKRKEYSDEPVAAVYEVGHGSKEGRAESVPADCKSLYDSILPLLEKLSTNTATRFRDTADRNLDQNNCDALKALLDTVKRMASVPAGGAA